MILSSYKALVMTIGLIYSLYNLITLEIPVLLCMGGVGGVRKGNNRVSHSDWSLPGHDDGVTHITKLILSLATRLLALVSSKLAIPHTDESWPNFTREENSKFCLFRGAPRYFGTIIQRLTLRHGLNLVVI